MKAQISQSIEDFKALIKNPPAELSAKEVGEEVWEIWPAESDQKLNKKYALTLMAVTHGNEVGGISILQAFTAEIYANPNLLQSRICIALGNSRASRENVRFLERDLNRSFAAQSISCWEEKRAKELEPFLADSRFFLDLHQTIEPSERPFFIFPYTKEGYRFARHIDSNLSIVTHFGKKFSADGMCTDDYVNKMGGVGISIETGGKGFCQDQTSLGREICLKTLQVAETLGDKEQLPSVATPDERSPIFTWATTEMYPKEHVKLVSGLSNFQKITKGELLGESKTERFLATTDGYLIFPKYVDPDSSKPRPAELYRVLKEISEADLPEVT